MRYTNKELGFILYNNRSINMVKTFIRNINLFKLVNIEKEFQISKDKFNDNKKMVEIPIKELLIDEEDVLVTLEEINSLTNLVNNNIGKFNENEMVFLKNKKMPDEVIKKWKLLGLSNITDKKHLEIIGATVHPVMKDILTDGVEFGGILFPLFEDGLLTNCSIRKIDSSGSLKYGLSCPDIPVWFNDIEDDEIWITEGLFDMYALDYIGKKAATCSSAIWSGPQLYRLLEIKPRKINIFSDDDEVGLRTSFKLKHYFNTYHNIKCTIYKSDRCKDAAEHIFEKGGTLDDLIEVTDYTAIEEDDSFNFIDYLKYRKY